MKIDKFEDIEAWKRSRELVQEIYSLKHRTLNIELRTLFLRR